MDLTDKQKNELNIANQRVASGAGTETDVKNLQYAKSNYNFEPMTIDDFKPEENIELPDEKMNEVNVAPDIQGAQNYSKTLEDYIKELTPPATETTKQVSTLSEEMSKLREQFAMKPQEQLEAEKIAGVPNLQKELSSLNTQINTRLAEYDLLSKQAEATPEIGGMKIVRRFQTALEREKAAEVGLLQAKALGMQGELETAQNTANRAIDLKYSVLENNIGLYELQLDAIKETLSREEDIFYEAQKRMIEDEKQRIADEKEEELNQANLAIQGYRKLLPSQLYQVGLEAKKLGLDAENLIVRMPNGDIYKKPFEEIQALSELGENKKGDGGKIKSDELTPEDALASGYGEGDIIPYNNSFYTITPAGMVKKLTEKQAEAIVNQENEEIELDDEQKKLQSIINSELQKLAKGGKWGTSWNYIKNLYPDIPNETLDEALRKDDFYEN